ncbi:MAG: DNA repair protein RecO [Cyanobacteria bacterium SIG30]|nr:DNA repair protein RecO [Cyanobacteria bacterium SIG30]
MENFVTDAINIKTYPLSEHDNIVLMFSRQGLIKGVAKGVKRPKSKLGARMQVLVANKLMLHKGRNLDTICQAQALNTFNKLRYDFDKLSYGMYLGELVSIFCKENSNSEEIYDIFYMTLEKISESSSKTEILLYVLKFQLKFMQILGYGIELKKCSICGCTIEENPIFLVDEGCVLCKKCEYKSLNKTKIPTKIRDFLSTIMDAKIEDKTIYDELVNEKICKTCFDLLKKYIDKQSPTSIKTLKILEENLV